MTFKKSLEKNPARCRELRQIKSEIDRQLKTIDASIRDGINKVREWSDKRGKMKKDAKNLGIQIAAATIASGVSGPVGNVIGATASHLDVLLKVLESNIDAIEKQIAERDGKIDDFKRHRDRLQTSWTQNAAELKTLNCVR